MIDLVLDEGVQASALPDPARFEAAALAACRAAGVSGHAPVVCLRICDDEAMRELNRTWRKMDAPTDVLSFPMQDGPEYDLSEPLGDIVMSWPCIERVAAEQGLDPQHHGLHLLIHGALHLLGYDHTGNGDAAHMQACERRAMHDLGLHDPYANMDEAYA